MHNNKAFENQNIMILCEFTNDELQGIYENYHHCSRPLKSKINLRLDNHFSNDFHLKIQKKN